MSDDWRNRLAEAAELIRTRYDAIGANGAPFLIVTYPEDAELAVLEEWGVQSRALQPEFEPVYVDVAAEWGRMEEEIGLANIEAMTSDPMPGSDPIAELGDMFATRVTTLIQTGYAGSTAAKPFMTVQGLGRMYPFGTPALLMHRAWDHAGAMIAGRPVVFLTPGTYVSPQEYIFMGERREHVYRGRLIG